MTTLPMRLEIAEGEGRVTVSGWDRQHVGVEGAADAPAVGSDGIARLHGVRGDVVVHVPFGSAVRIERQQGDVTCSAVGAVALRDVVGVVVVENADTLVIERDAERRNRRFWQGTRRDITARDVREIRIAEAHDRLVIERAERAEVGAVGGSAEVSGVRQSLSIGAVGGSCHVTDCGEHVKIDDIGGTATVQGVSGGLSLRNIGGSADIQSVGTLLAVGSVGGRLTLVDAPLEIDRDLRVAIGGSARIELPVGANLAISAIVGGGMVTPSSRHGSGMHRVVFGNGGSTLGLTVGGTLTVVEVGTVAV